MTALHDSRVICQEKAIEKSASTWITREGRNYCSSEGPFSKRSRRLRVTSFYKIFYVYQF